MTDDERRRLYEEVWAEPMVVVAKRYGLSDVGMAKLCHRAQIPIPPRGYWARLRAGQQLGGEPLADAEPQDIARLSIPDRTAAALRQAVQSDSDAAAALAREKHPSFAIDAEANVPPHPIAVHIEAAYSARQADSDGLLVATKGQKLAISVELGCLARGLRIIGLIAHACDARGWKAALARSPAANSAMRPLQVELLGCVFDMSLEEGVICVEVPRPTLNATLQRSPRVATPYVLLGAAKPGMDYESRPDGRLTLVARLGWQTLKIGDRPKRGPIECRLSELFNRMIRVAADHRAEEARKRREEEALDLAWREREEREHVRQFRVQLVDEIEAQAGQWAKHLQLNTYIAAVREAYAAEPHLVAPDQPLGRWLAWADAHAAQLDPRRRRKLDPENPPPAARQPRPVHWRDIAAGPAADR